MVIADNRIDIVYLWVDGSDPRWQARRQLALRKNAFQQPGSMGRYADVQGRYRDNDELRFNLRALERFFPDHGHIYIVTDNQAPAWLQTHAGLTLIDHRDLLPAAALPVFDSGHIESYLHHIPGLSERFLYLNDDVFFGAPVDVALWFAPSGAAVFNEYAAVPDYDCLQPLEDPLVNASLLSKEWLSSQNSAYEHVGHIFAHSPRPMFKSLMLELESAAPELFHQVRSTVFRSWAVPPLIPDLVPRWMLETGRATLQEADFMYLCTGDDDSDDQFQQLGACFGSLLFFCINDTSDEVAQNSPELTRIRLHLERLLPLPSRFECSFMASALTETSGETI